MNKKEKAIKNFETMNCNQSVLAAYGPDYGIHEELCFNLGLSFGGGMGKQGKTCGAVTGAYTVIGLWSATQSNNKAEQKQIAARMVNEFTKRFSQLNNSVECKALLNFDMSIPDEALKIEELGLTKTICPNLVGSSAQILEEILH